MRIAEAVGARHRLPLRVFVELDDARVPDIHCARIQCDRIKPVVNRQ